MHKAEVLLRIGWTLFALSKLEEARKRIDEMESILSSTDNKVDLLSVIGLNAIVMNGSKDAMKKCNKFIEIYESNKDSLKNNISSNIIGLVYSVSAENHFSKKRLNIAYKHCIYAIEYLKQDLESADDDFSGMIANLNLGTAYETALEIAENKLNSEFWEAEIMMYLAEAPSYQVERCHHLKKAKEIFMKLNHMELVRKVNEIFKTYGC